MMAMEKEKAYYFSGIGGSGMSSLAQVLRLRGCTVRGSDRSFDRRQNLQLFRKLRLQGIELVPQHADSITADIGELVISTAIERTSPEIQRAAELSIPVAHRAELLARLFNDASGIAVGGTSGKTTVTAMIASVLDGAGLDPSFINGGLVKQYISRTLLGNARCGASPWLVCEADESDGSIIGYRPRISVITNITKDHKELPELRQLFTTFAAHTQEALMVCADCPEASAIPAGNAKKITYGLTPGCDCTPEAVDLRPAVTYFHLGGVKFRLGLPGRHNLLNALAAIAVARQLDIPLKQISRGISAFKGVRRRLDFAGRRNGVLVVDDFGHNPDKIAASINALRPIAKRLIIVFQPHGYGPTRFLMHELASSFSENLGRADILVCLKIYDAGGTADRSVSAADLLALVKGPRCENIAERKDVITFLQNNARPGDLIAVMGARDDTLSAFARQILKKI
jgi:UDP-N-acetylmuramate--alanine ligase